MKGIRINPRMAFRTTRNKNQQCVYCGKALGYGKIGLSVNNKDDGLELRKNLWFHIECVGDFTKLIKKHLNGVHGAYIASRMI